MTLIIGIVCKDGVVLAADSATSDPETGTKQPMEKIKRIGEEPILYGGSGDVGLLQKIDENLATLKSKSVLKNTRKEIKKLIVPEQKEACQFHSPYPQPGFHQPPPAILLFGGAVGVVTPGCLKLKKMDGILCTLTSWVTSLQLAVENHGHKLFFGPT